MAIFGDKIKIKCNEEFIELSCKGDSGTMTTKIKEEDIIEYALEENEDGSFCETVELVYGLQYLNTFCMFSKRNDPSTRLRTAQNTTICKIKHLAFSILIFF